MSDTEFRQHRVEMILRADTAIAHHEGTVGNVGVVMRRTVFLPDGRRTKVPIITGDTVRHGLREASAIATLEAAGLLQAVHGESALRLLFAGGQMLKGTGTLKLDDYREMCELFPPLALLGGCAGNRIVPGRMSVSDAVLVCEETRHQMPSWVLDALSERQLSGARAHVERVQRVRMDPMLRPEQRALLSDGERRSVEERLRASDVASGSGDALAAVNAKSTMMPHSYECVCAGSLFFLRIDARTTTLLESDTFAVMLAAWLHGAQVGGKKGTGHGKLSLVDARGLVRSAASEPQLDALAIEGEPPELARYKAHVAERSERLATWLAKVQA